MDFDTALRRSSKYNLYDGVSCSPALQCFLSKRGGERNREIAKKKKKTKKTSAGTCSSGVKRINRGGVAYLLKNNKSGSVLDQQMDAFACYFTVPRFVSVDLTARSVDRNGKP